MPTAFDTSIHISPSPTTLPNETDVIIIGNGPCSLFLSYILHGEQPTYLKDKPHPDAYLHHFFSFELNSLLDPSSLSTLTPHLLNSPYTSHPRSQNPSSLLFDTLFRPSADIDLYPVSRLRWNKGHSTVKHVVLGSGYVGGTWWSGSERSVSRAGDTDLPGLNWGDWARERNKMNKQKGNRDNVEIIDEDPAERPMRRHVAQYYRDYIRAVGIEDAIWEHVRVTRVEDMKEALLKDKCACAGKRSARCKCATYRYLVTAVYQEVGKKDNIEFRIKANAIVLATGCFESAKWIGVKGEDGLRVWHSVSEMIKGVDNTEKSKTEEKSSKLVTDYPTPPPSPLYSLNPHVTTTQSQQTAKLTLSLAPLSVPAAPPSQCHPYLVIGSGLSAADALLQLHARNLPTMHIYHHRTPTNPNAHVSPLASYSRSEYPEYARIFCQMKRSAMQLPANDKMCEPIGLYTGLPNARLLSIQHNQDGSIIASIATSSSSSPVTMQLSGVAILVGHTTALSFLSEKLTHTVGASGASVGKGIKTDPWTGRPLNADDHDNIFALGAVTGTTLVRFGVGSGLGLAGNLMKEFGSE